MASITNRLLEDVIDIRIIQERARELEPDENENTKVDEDPDGPKPDGDKPVEPENNSEIQAMRDELNDLYEVVFGD